MHLLTKVLYASLAMLPVVTFAGDLEITNHSYYDLSFRVNNVCSDLFGVIPSDTTKVIAEKEFNEACKSSPRNCAAIVFSQPGCKGKLVSEVFFDTSYGVSMVSVILNKPISITASGFKLIFVSPLYDKNHK